MPDLTKYMIIRRSEWCGDGMDSVHAWVSSTLSRLPAGRHSEWVSTTSHLRESHHHRMFEMARKHRLRVDHSFLTLVQ